MKSPWIGVGALLLLAVLYLLRSSPSPAAAPGSTASSTAHATDALPVSAPTAKPLKAVDPAEMERRFDVAGRQRFATLPAERQADEMAEILTAEATALDRSQQELLRVRAFQSLAARGALSREAATALAELLQNSTEAITRADLSKASKGHLTDRPELVEALLSRLQTDPNEMVRKRAAQSLGECRTDPRVKAALEQSMTTDASPFVRDAVRATLQGQALPELLKKS